MQYLHPPPAGLPDWSLAPGLPGGVPLFPGALVSAVGCSNHAQINEAGISSWGWWGKC